MSIRGRAKRHAQRVRLASTDVEYRLTAAQPAVSAVFCILGTSLQLHMPFTLSSLFPLSCLHISKEDLPSSVRCIWTLKSDRIRKSWRSAGSLGAQKSIEINGWRSIMPAPIPVGESIFQYTPVGGLMQASCCPLCSILLGTPKSIKGTTERAYGSEYGSVINRS